MAVRRSKADPDVAGSGRAVEGAVRIGHRIPSARARDDAGGMSARCGDPAIVRKSPGFSGGTSIMHRTYCGLLAGVLTAASALSHSQTAPGYPAKPVRIVV